MVNNYFKLSKFENCTFIVKVVSVEGKGNRFQINNVITPTLQLQKGKTYIFNQKHPSNANHPLRFSETKDGIHNNGKLLQEPNVNYISNTIIKIKVDEIVNSPFYFFCLNH